MKRDEDDCVSGCFSVWIAWMKWTTENIWALNRHPTSSDFWFPVSSCKSWVMAAVTFRVLTRDQDKRPRQRAKSQNGCDSCNVTGLLRGTPNDVYSWAQRPRRIWSPQMKTVPIKLRKISVIREDNSREDKSVWWLKQYNISKTVVFRFRESLPKPALSVMSHLHEIWLTVNKCSSVYCKGHQDIGTFVAHHRQWNNGNCLLLKRLSTDVLMPLAVHRAELVNSEPCVI
jgi:hypothetical protein